MGWLWDAFWDFPILSIGGLLCLVALFILVWYGGG